LTNQAGKKSKTALDLASVLPLIFVAISAIVFTLTIKRSSNVSIIGGNLSPTTVAQDASINTATILQDVANMEPSRLLALGKIDEAVGEAMKELKANPNDFRTIMCAGNVLSQSGDKQRGIQLLRQTVGLSSQSRYVRLNFARHLATAGQYNEAFKQYEYLCDSFAKEWLEPRNELVQLCIQNNKPAVAAQQQKIILDVALEMGQDDNATRRAYALSLARSGKADEGFAQYSKACADKKEEQPYAASCKEVLEQYGNSQRKAISELRDDIELRQKQIKPRLTMIELLLYLGRYQDARDSANAALKLEPKNPYLYELIAEVNLKLDNKEAAQAAFNRAAMYTFIRH
jgi:tetratricopeptide (TPR) repeat protein